MSANPELRGPSAVITSFLKCAERTPEKIAIADEKVSLTYRELRERVIAFGSQLVAQRIGIESNVVQAILADRSVESVVAVLSCIYTGIPFAPLDGEAPIERTVTLLERLKNPTIVLSVPKFMNIKLPKRYSLMSTRASVIAVGEHMEPQSVNLDDLALVIFTSGSTGAPKGVMFDWQSFAPKIFQARNYSPDEIPTMRLSVTQPIFFSSGLGRQLSLCMGISIFLLDATRLSPVELLERAVELEITNFSAPPSVIKNLGHIPLNQEIKLPSVRLIETGAEGIRFEDLASVARYFNEDVQVSHGLGATEGSCKIRNFFFLKDAPLTGQVPLGIQIEPDQMWLLPPRNSDNPAQEILMGARLALGYLDDPALTAERFIYDDRGRRWWKSGDLVVKDDDGVFWHKGRIDDLVKVRGKLVSPSEATHVLVAIPGIQSVIVLPHDIGGAIRLVAHLVLSDQTGPTARSVRRVLATSLPSHLNPALLMKHESLPLGNRGKIDRVALQANPVLPWRDEPIIHPLSAAEFSVLNEAMIVLDLDELSITDDLWEFGLDSLTAIELISRLEHSATRRLSIDDLLRSRTVEQVAKRLKSSFIPHFENLRLNESGSRPIFFAIPGIGGHASHFVHLARAMGDDQPIVVFPDISNNPKDLSIETEAIRIASQIPGAENKGTIYLAGYSGGGILAVEVARNLLEKGLHPHLLLIDAGGRQIEREFREGANLPSWSFLSRKVQGIVGLRQKFGWRRGLTEVWFGITHKYLGLKYLNILFWLTGGKYPRGIARYEFLARRKAKARIGFQIHPIDCSATYFAVVDNEAFRRWEKIINHLRVVEVPGDHRTMLHPPHVVELARLIAEEMGM